MEVINSKIDSGYNFADYSNNLKEARRIVNELLEIGNEQKLDSVLMCTYFIMGSIHYNLPTKDSALYYFEKARQIALQNNDRIGEGRAIRSKGIIHFEMGSYNKALANFDSSLSIYYDIQDSANIIRTLLERTWLNNQAEKTSEALKDYLSGLDYAIAFKDTISQAQFYDGLSILHKKQKNYEVADAYSEKCIALYALLKDEFKAAMAKSNLALSYKAQGYYEKAYAIYIENLLIYDEFNFNYGLMSCYNNMAICSNLMGKYKRALEEGLTGLKISHRLGAKEAEADVSIEIGKAYLALGNTKKALDFSLQSLSLANGLVTLEKRRDAHKILSDVYMTIDDYQLALEHFKSFKLVNDSIFNINKSDLVLNLQEKYETAQREKEINELKAEAEISELKRRSIVIVLIIVIIAAILIINREIRRRKKAKALHAVELKLNELEKQRLADELAFKKRELTALALQIAQKNEMFKELKNDLVATDSEDKINYRQLYKKLDLEKQVDKSWEQFIRAFTETNASFFKELTKQYPEMTKSELRLCALLKMKLSSKDIASILNISDQGIKKARYRLRKKMGMDTQDNLESAIISLN
jgi:tetratricopeptide (TPR) repeat protein